jgi:hypothetical protein
VISIDFATVSDGQLVTLGLAVLVLFWLGHLGRVAIDLWVSSMRRAGEPSLGQRGDDAARLVRKGRRHNWDSMAPMLVEDETAADVSHSGTLASELSLHGLLPETLSETSGRHAKVEADDTATGLMTPVDDEAAFAIVAAVSGEDGAK